MHKSHNVIANRLGRVVTVSALLWLGVGTASAQSGVWTANGPEGASVLTLAIDPQTPSTVYAGTRSGGVFKSTDCGETWIAVNNGLTSGFVGALAIDPRTPTTIYAMSVGIFKSTDGAASWNAVNNGIPDSQLGSLVALIIDPQVPATLYLGTQGTLLKTTDGGGSWNFAGLFTQVPVLAIDPYVSSTVYAATHSNGTNPRLRKSIDGGASWNVTALDGNMVYSAAIDPQDATTVYAGTCNLDGSLCGVVKSTDGGDSWIEMRNGLPADGIIRSLAIDPQTPSTLYAGVLGSGVFKSTDAGGSWVAINDGLTNLVVRAVAIDPLIPTTLFAGTDGNGVFRRTEAVRPPHYTLTVTRTGLGRGSVTSSPGGVDCGGTCVASFEGATTVKLTATPGTLSIFMGWTGCDADSGQFCWVTMTADRSVNAKFLGIPVRSPIH